MWMLDNQTPYAAERNWVRDRDGLHLWIVAVKATFEFAPDGALALAEAQPPPLLAPEYFGEPGRSSLRGDSDLLARKPGTDVILNGSAWAPRGRAATSVPVRLRVGEVDKALVVHGERRYVRGVTGVGMTSPMPFVSRPIRYEAAFGGADLAGPDPRAHRFDARNPIGRGIASSREALDGTLAHDVEFPRGDAAKLGPAGFGGIDASWSPRRECAGTYDDAWEQHRRPLLPLDYDEAFAQCAPLDQRPAAPLRGGEAVELSHLTPEGLVRFALPKIFLAFRTRVAGRSVEHRAHLTTVLLEPDERRLALVWQTSLPVRQADSEYLDETSIREKQLVS